MNLKIAYGFIFGILGLIVASLLTVFFVIFGLGIFWLFIFGDNEWPAWTDAVLFGPGPVIVFLFVWITSLIIGVKHGKNLEKESNQKEIQKKARFWIIASIIIFIIFVLLVTLRIISSK